MRKYKFKSLRVKKFDPAPLQPDYSNIIKLNKTYFTLTGWLDLHSNISFVLEEINQERLKNDKFLRTNFAAYLSAENKKT